MKRWQLALPLLPFLMAAGSLESYTLKPLVHKGDQWTTTAEFDLDLTMTVGEKEKAEESSFRFVRKDKFDTEVLEANDDLASKVRRDYTKSTVTIRSKTGKNEAVEKQEDTALHQTSVTLEKEDVDPPSHLFLPSGKTEEGKEWTVEGKNLESFFRQQIAGKRREISNLTGTLKVMLKGMKEEKGKKVVEIPIEGDLSLNLSLTPESATEAQIHPLVFHLKGVLHFEPSSSRPLHFLLEGKGETREEPGHKAPGGDYGSIRLSIDVEDRARPSGEAIKLVAKFHVGDIYTRIDTEKFEMSVDEFFVKLNGKKMEGMEQEEKPTKASVTTKAVDEVLEASDGKIKKLRREFQEIKIEADSEKDSPPDPLLALEGKTVLVEQDGKEIQAKLEGSGKVDEKILKSIRLGDEFKLLLPDEEVKKGAAWNPDEKKLLDFFVRCLPDDEDENGETVDIGVFSKTVLKHMTGGFDCRLISIAEEEGIPTARIGLKAKFELDVTDGDFPKAVRDKLEGEQVAVSISGKLEGDFYFDYKSGKPIKLSLSGPLSLKEKKTLSGDGSGLEVEVSVRASGNLEYNQSFSQGRGGK